VSPPSSRTGFGRFLFSGQGWPYVLVPMIPIAIGLEVVHASAPLIFFAAALGVIPTAALMGRATEELATRSGPGIGGLLNVTFGNAPELIIAFFALNEGLQEVVKASLVGSIIGNILLVMGAAMFVGGVTGGRRSGGQQTFEHRAASAQALLLLLALGALALPAVFMLVSGPGLPKPNQESVHYTGDVITLSAIVAVILLISYAGALLFSLKTHKDLFNPVSEDEEEGEPWSVRRSVIVLAIAGLAVGVMSEILVGSISETATKIGLSEFFIGVIVVAIVGNAAEHWVAVYVAAKDKMDLAVNIAIGSSAQIALFAAPVLVLLSFFVGDYPMPLVFNGYELVAIVLAVLVADRVTSEGESNWHEGLQLLCLYLVIGVTFFFA
jgi:Ca2+:H+ antiporter